MQLRNDISSCNITRTHCMIYPNTNDNETESDRLNTKSSLLWSPVEVQANCHFGCLRDIIIR
jgi:hypothetical protein